MPVEEIWELGTLYWDDTAERITAKGIPLFNSPEILEELAGRIPYVVGRDGFLEVINMYKNKIISMYRNLLVDDEERKSHVKQMEHIKANLVEWECGIAINLKEDVEKITSSWSYEYCIFELVKILKTMNFKEYTILFYGR